MPRKNVVSDKQVYALWWEYLKRSEKYKRLWDLRRTREGRSEASRLEDEFPETMLWFFGDVHRVSFEKWWAADPLSKKKNTVQDYFWQLPEEIDHIIEEWKKEGKSCSGQSLQEHMKIWFSDRVLSHKQVCLLITLEDPANIDDALEQIKARLNDERKKLIKEDEFGESSVPPRLYPTPPIRFDELKRYLDVYDLRKQGKKWTEVSKLIYPRREWEESLERSLLMDLVKAKKIISNTEAGEFPGQY